MPKSIVAEGKTTNEAISEGLKQLNVSKDKVEIKVLENTEKRSFFSILAPRVVKVELTLKEDIRENNHSKEANKENETEHVEHEKRIPLNDDEVKKVKQNVETFLKELSEISSIDYKEYGMKLLKSGMNFENYSTQDIIYHDFKTYSVLDYKFGIGQILTVDYNDYKNTIDAFVEELNTIAKNNNYELCTLFITNIIDKSSCVIYNIDSEKIIKDAYNLENIYEGIIIKDILSRKKQIVPNIMEVIEKIN